MWELKCILIVEFEWKCTFTMINHLMLAVPIGKDKF